MKYVLLGCFALAMLGCGGPRPMMKVHVLSQNETNQGRALPMHVVPLDQALRIRMDGMSAEDWFTSDDANNLTGIQKRVLRGAQQEVLQLQRRDQKNDFLIIVDFAEVEGSDQQKMFLGDRYYKAKDVYVIVTTDRMRVVSKDVFNDYLKSN